MKTVILLTILAIAAALLPGEMLELQRGGEPWRIVTCHFTHWTYEQLAWDGLAFAALGIACARRNRAAFHAILLASVIMIPIAVLMFQPQMQSYRGLSGIASALFAYLLTKKDWLLPFSPRRGEKVAEGRMRGPDQRPSPGPSPRKRGEGQYVQIAIAVIFFAKLAFEFATGGTIFVQNMGAGVVSVPIAHVVGACIGVIAAIFSGAPGSRQTVPRFAG